MGLYLTTNNGVNWQLSLPINSTVWALASSGSYIYAGVDGSPYGIFKSSNYGTNWSQTSLNNVGVHALAVYGNFVFAGASNGVYVSSDNGTTWVQRNEGMGGNLYTISMCIYNGFIFIGTSGQGVWRRLLSELVGIKTISNEVPAEYELKQNYPNPFNPQTKIGFNIPSLLRRGAGVVKLKVYDILGREMETLVNEQLQPGTYEVQWDGNKFASGVYFCRLTANNKIIDTKKMVIAK